MLNNNFWLSFMLWFLKDRSALYWRRYSIWWADMLVELIIKIIDTLQTTVCCGWTWVHGKKKNVEWLPHSKQQNTYGSTYFEKSLTRLHVIFHLPIAIHFIWLSFTGHFVITGNLRLWLYCWILCDFKTEQNYWNFFVQCNVADFLFWNTLE